MVGELSWFCRRRYTALRCLLLLVTVARPGAGQSRVVEVHRADEPEGRLLAFYSAAMAFTPAGVARESGTTAGLEVTYVPWLDEARRRPSIDKPEATNLAPAFPRPRVAFQAGAMQLEVGWIPPVRLFDVEANLLSVAASARGLTLGSWTIAPRVWGVAGRVRGAITCATSTMRGRGADLELYYAAVCHGRESDDRFEPRMVGGEVLAAGRIGWLDMYAGAGARVDRTRFDIGVLRDDGSRDPDHPILELRSTRPHVMAGTSWRTGARVGAGLEVFYAPGSLLTARAAVRWRIRP